jgi:hypothetical protein
MSLKAKLLTHLASCEKMLRSGEDIIPSWHVMGAEGDWLIFTRFDNDKPEQLERLLYLMNRFMAWKLATGFTLGMEAWLGPDKTRQGGRGAVCDCDNSHRKVGRDAAHSSQEK